MLNQKYDVDLQLGASDQWTNILSGVELIRRKLGKEAYALTCPLVTDASGKKFGKSEGNAVWLDAQKTSPYAFYQFWLNQPDEVVGKYLKFYTFMSVFETDALIELHKRNPGKREAQRMLARLVTEIVAWRGGRGAEPRRFRSAVRRTAAFVPHGRGARHHPEGRADGESKPWDGGGRRARRYRPRELQGRSAPPHQRERHLAQ